jgi:hypothetical protein
MPFGIGGTMLWRAALPIFRLCYVGVLEVGLFPLDQLVEQGNYLVPNAVDENFRRELLRTVLRHSSDRPLQQTG